MLLNINDIQIDSIKINFNTDALWMLNIALAIIMFGIALDIKVSDFKILLKKPKAILVGILSQFILLPFLTFVAVYIINPYPSFALAMILVAACPGGNVSNFFSKMANGNTALSVSLTAFATLICLVMTPLNLHFWGSLYEPTNVILKSVSLNPFELFKLVLLILGIPIVLGMTVNHFHTEMAQKINKILRPFSIIFFVLLIVIALYDNASIFKNYIHLVLFLVIFHNIYAFIIGYTTAKVFKLNKKDTRTISMETGIQNSGLGLLLVFSFFDGLGGMALLAAFWGIWDMFSGMILATFWGNKKNN
ncbi:bile acid:sodium symporter family protein [Tenacibaculum ovolyticum]|uniref:bile acid:sodium symporter family protein n=1 Tax=Tenacibaculum ovolyticum TaxID=104270 RepID=UPI001F167FF7|nr:bile acid:sodium symporter family protein [Tenacibaculum ovolyticum]